MGGRCTVARVLILPWLDQKAIYDQYRFDEPWDGPNNRKLHDLIVPTYACPSHPRQGHSTSYVAVVGPETAWRGAEPMRLEDVHDGPDQTIRLVEVSEPSIHWMEPRDLDFDQMQLHHQRVEQLGRALESPSGRGQRPLRSTERSGFFPASSRRSGCGHCSRSPAAKRWENTDE